MVAGVDGRLLVWVLRRVCFFTRELAELGLGMYGRREAVRELLRLGVVERVQKGMYCLRGEWVLMMLSFASGRSAEDVVEEWLAAVAGVAARE